MTNNAEREGFEVHIKSEWAKNNYPMGVTDLSKHGVTGEYLKPMAAAAWSIWQARAQASGVPDVTWENIGSLQIDSYATGRRMAVVHIIGDEVRINVTDGNYEWITRIDPPWVKRAAPTPPKSASVPVERLEALIKESEGCRDYVTLIELVELLAEYK